tara:strand:- start:1058 stop:1528 length:471 start_codon:yes stop_codon:yes gene_type:complete
MIVKMEHVLILVIAAFVLYHFSRCNCGNGFSIGIGDVTRCYGKNERSCSDNLTICNWYNEKCHVINCSTYNNDIGACRNEEICTPLRDVQGSIECARYGHHHNSEEGGGGGGGGDGPPPPVAPRPRPQRPTGFFAGEESSESSDEESGHEEAEGID